MQNMFENDRANQSSEGLIKDCHFCWWQTKGLIVAVTMIALASCQTATTPSSYGSGRIKINDIKTRLGRAIRPNQISS